MGCRSFLTVYKDEMTIKFYGRFNQGVVNLKPCGCGMFFRKRYEQVLGAYG